jgi:hypothetical protein
MLVVGLLPLSASADEWLVRKNRGNANCSVQLASSGADPAPNSVSTHATRKEACEAAKALATSDAKSCAGYTPNTVAECKKEGVDLP